MVTSCAGKMKLFVVYDSPVAVEWCMWSHKHTNDTLRNYSNYLTLYERSRALGNARYNSLLILCGSLLLRREVERVVLIDKFNPMLKLFPKWRSQMSWKWNESSLWVLLKNIQQQFHWVTWVWKLFKASYCEHFLKIIKQHNARVTLHLYRKACQLLPTLCSRSEHWISQCQQGF
jgi:hypothetical protein